MPEQPVDAVQPTQTTTIQADPGNVSVQEMSHAAQPDPADLLPQAQRDTIQQDLSDVAPTATIPAALIDQARQQLREGVPLEQVLKNLREGLHTAAEAVVPGVGEDGHLPVASSQAADATASISDEVLLAQLGVRDANLPGKDSATVAQAVVAPRSAPVASSATAVALPTAVQMVQSDAPTDPEVAPEPELPDLPEWSLKDSAPARDRALLAGRITALEPGSTAAQVTHMTPAAPLKELVLPTALNAIMPPLMQGEAPGETLTIPQRVGEPGWGQQLAQRVMWMVGRDLQAAELKLNPAHLGPLEIKVTMHKQDQANVTLLASNPAVRDALEQALPRLRDMLGQQDIQLVQADVGQRHDARHGGAAGSQFGGQQPQAGHDGQHPVPAGAGPDDVGQESQVTVRSQGLLDAYA